MTEGVEIVEFGMEEKEGKRSEEGKEKDVRVRNGNNIDFFQDQCAIALTQICLSAVKHSQPK